MLKTRSKRNAKENIAPKLRLLIQAREWWRILLFIFQFVSISQSIVKWRKKRESNLEYGWKRNIEWHLKQLLGEIQNRFVFYPWNGLRSCDPTRWIKMSAPTGTIMFRCVYFCIEFSSFRSRSGYLNSVLMSLLLPLIGLYSIFIWPSRHTIPRFVLC